MAFVECFDFHVIGDVARVCRAAHEAHLAALAVAAPNCPLIGNGQPGAGNLIVGSGTASTGILIRDGAAENEVYGNWIGLNAAGTLGVGYVGTGISILNASDNIIGANTRLE